MDGRFFQQGQVFLPRRTVVTECKNGRFDFNDGNLSVTKKDGQGYLRAISLFFETTVPFLK